MTAGSQARTASRTNDPAKGVNFTNKGDRAAVKYNFFKMTMSKASLGM